MVYLLVRLSRMSPELCILLLVNPLVDRVIVSGFIEWKLAKVYEEQSDSKGKYVSLEWPILPLHLERYVLIDILMHFWSLVPEGTRSILHLL